MFSESLSEVADVAAPRTDFGAYIASEDPRADLRSELRRNGSAVLDGLVADARSRVEFVRREFSSTAPSLDAISKFQRDNEMRSPGGVLRLRASNNPTPEPVSRTDRELRDTNATSSSCDVPAQGA